METIKKDVRRYPEMKKDFGRSNPKNTCNSKHSHHIKCQNNGSRSKNEGKCTNCKDIWLGRRKYEASNVGPSPVQPSKIKTTTVYLTNVNKVVNAKRPALESNYVVENLMANHKSLNDSLSRNLDWLSSSRCCCINRHQRSSFGFQVSNNYKSSMPSKSIGVNTEKVLNAGISKYHPVLRNYSVYNCLTIQDDLECKCRPPKPSPPCYTFDCDCITETGNIAARKEHKPFCPCFKHKSTCPVMMNKEDEEKRKLEEEEDEAEPLPYGLPPIQLGPCPVMGKPCANPDGFAKMYKTQTQVALPASYSDAGKVCCSKEYDRIKKAIQDYMRYEKDHDHRCITTFNVDTERRCCDKEQKVFSLLGKDCCGTHKLAIQKKYKEDRQ